MSATMSALATPRRSLPDLQPMNFTLPSVLEAPSPPEYRGMSATPCA